MVKPFLEFAGEFADLEANKFTLRELGHVATTDDVLVAVGATATHWATIEPKDGNT
jgi:hypothetical protein